MTRAATAAKANFKIRLDILGSSHSFSRSPGAFFGLLFLTAADWVLERPIAQLYAD